MITYKDETIYTYENDFKDDDPAIEIYVEWKL